MLLTISDFLAENGPSRSSMIVDALIKDGLSSEAARQRVARVRRPVFRFPLRLLPKNEAFLYLDHQRPTELFWTNFLRDMRETGSIYGMAIDGLLARGSVIRPEEFAVISGAPLNPMKGQVSATRVEDVLTKASFIERSRDLKGEECLRFKGSARYTDTRWLSDLVLLDAVREWVRRLGFASYNSIAIRGERELKPIGPFLFDLAGPSYFAPIQSGGAKPGFFVADIFSQTTLDEHHIRYFVRKVGVLSAMKLGVKIMPMLVAEGFTGPALTAGHAAGISLATPETLFGRRAGAAFASLVQTLQNAAAYASSETPDRIVGLLRDLVEIEGRAGNLRGVLFELMAAYLARRDAVSIEMGVIARDPVMGKAADIDILKIKAMASEVVCIECKGREPGGLVSADEVTEWLRKIPTIKAHLGLQPSLREALHRFEIWTSGGFREDALALLRREQQQRTKSPIGWKDGEAVYDLARAAKEKAMADAFQQHFRRHPFAEVAVAARPTTGTTAVTSYEPSLQLATDNATPPWSR